MGMLRSNDKFQTCKLYSILRNKPLQRIQFAIRVYRADCCNVSKKELEDRIAGIFKPIDKKQVIVWGLHTSCGGKLTGLGLVYDSLDAVRRFESRHRQLRLGLIKKDSHSRKQIKERKNRAKKTRGCAKRSK